MADSILPQDHSIDNLKRDLGLSIDMLDVDYLRKVASVLLRTGSAPDAYRLDELSDELQIAIRDIGVLRAALHLNDEVR